MVWVVTLHKHLGVLACFLILLHPVFITAYYLAKFRQNLFLFDLSVPFGWFVLLGLCALAILGLIYVTSVPLRKYLRKSRWYIMHLTSYILLPAVFVHSFAIGMTVRGTSLRWFWVGLAVIVGGFLLHRLAFRVGLFSSRYVVVSAKAAAVRVIDITLRPVRKGIWPKMGQFVYLRRKPMQTAHPYTISAYDRPSGSMSITAKAQGATSTDLQKVLSGETMTVDGPYGVFAWHALESRRPLAMIAGGIGITPFRRLMRVLEKRKDRPAWLFYGSKRYEDIVYRDELKNLAHVKVVHVLEKEPRAVEEKGFISIGLLRKYLGDDLARYEFLLCGPPIMISLLESGLLSAMVPAGQIHHELFSW
jgi:sulfhydrogenase subunit gamma (sulfur reductase)